MCVFVGCCAVNLLQNCMFISMNHNSTVAILHAQCICGTGLTQTCIHSPDVVRLHQECGMAASFSSTSRGLPVSPGTMISGCLPACLSTAYTQVRQNNSNFIARKCGGCYLNLNQFADTCYLHGSETRAIQPREDCPSAQAQ